MVVIGHLKHNVVDSYNWILKQFQQVNAKCLSKHDQKFLSVPLQHLLKSSLAMQERFGILKGFHWSPKTKNLVYILYIQIM